MKTDLKGRVDRLLDKKLTAEQKRLLQLMSIENQKGVATFRMPIGVISLETVWMIVQEALTEAKVPFKRVNTFATLEELDDILSDVDWLWPGWLPTGFNTLLAGDPGVGKSIIALDWADKVSKGEPWPLQLPTDKGKPRNVVWIETEASQQILNMRAKAFDMDRKKIFLPVIDGDVMGQPDIAIEAHREQILQLIEAKEPALVILDSLGSGQSRGENRKEDIAPVMEFFAMVARDYTTGVIIVHHLRKMSQNEGVEVSLYRVRGSTAIPALSRTVIALDKPTDDKARISVIKSNLARIGKPISVTFEYGGDKEDVKGMTYEAYQPPPPKRLKKELVADWVMTQLRESKGNEIGLKELTDRGEGYGYTRNNLYAAKDLLGDRIAVGGTGNSAVWTLAADDDEEASEHLAKAHRKKGQAK